MSIQALLARFSSLPPRSRIVLAAALVAIVCCGLFGSFAARDTRTALYPYALIPEQVDEVDRKLAELNVLHVAGADNVRVDAKQRDQLRARLAELGIPHRHLASTAESLDKVGALTPQAVLESQQLEGLDADVALGLRSFAGVEDARVTIAPAKSGVYADEKSTETTAAVTLRLAPQARVNGSTIRKYIAASVPGLDAQHVAVVDDRGVELADDGGATASSGSMQSTLQSELDRILGDGQAIVAVTVVRDGRRREIRDVRRSPVGERAIATTHSEERYASERKHYVKTNGSEDRGSDVREERIESAPGGTERLSVAVTVDAVHGGEIPKIRDIAAASVGFDRDRGDTVSVVAIPFAHRTSAQTAALPHAPAWLGTVLALLPSMLTGLAVVVTLAIVAKPAFAMAARTIDRASIKDVTAGVIGVAPVHVRGALAGEPPHTAAAVISALPTATAAAVLELYPPEERAAIVRRLSRPASPLLPSYEELLRADRRV